MLRLIRRHMSHTATFAKLNVDLHQCAGESRTACHTGGGNEHRHVTGPDSQCNHLHASCVLICHWIAHLLECAHMYTACSAVHRLAPWMRRALTRGIAIIPAAIVSGISGNAGAARLLILSQVILSLALPFAVIPLVHFTTSRQKMGRFVNGWVVTIIGVLLALVLSGLNAYLIVSTIINGDFGNRSGSA